MFLDRCQLLKESLDKPAITTDVIAGFPGETEDEFEQTLQTCRTAGFSKIHAFPFSARRGTPAAEMNDQIPKQLKADRVRRLTELENELRADYYRQLVGAELELLVESSRELVNLGNESTFRKNLRGDLAGKPTHHVLRGTTCRYAAGELLISRESIAQESVPRVGDLISVRLSSRREQARRATVKSSKSSSVTAWMNETVRSIPSTHDHPFCARVRIRSRALVKTGPMLLNARPLERLILQDLPSRCYRTIAARK